MSNDEAEYILAETGGRRNRLLVKLVPFEGHQLLDLRYWYTDSRGDLRPTRKGLSLTAGHFGVVAETLARYGSAIQAWLSGDGAVEELVLEADAAASTEAVRARQVAKQGAAREARSESQLVRSAVIDEPRSRACFSVEYRGGEEVVLFNKDHSFSERILGADSVDELRALLTAMLAAYGRARHSVEGEADEGFLDLLEHEWAERLSSAARRKYETEPPG